MSNASGLQLIGRFIPMVGDSVLLSHWLLTPCQSLLVFSKF